VIAAGLPLVASFVVSLVLAPWFGERVFGIYLLAMTVATFALIPAKFGIQVATSRLLSEHEDDAGNWLRSGLVLRMAFTLPTSAALFALAPFLASRLGGPDSNAAFAMAAAVVVSTSVFEFATEALVGLRAFRAQLLIRMVALALRLAAVFAVRYGGFPVEIFLVAHSVAFLAPGLVALAVLLFRHRGHTSMAGMRRTLQVATPLAFASASYMIYAHTDRLMIGWMHGPAPVAQFGIARNVIDAALFPIVALTWSLRPALVRAFQAGGTAAMRPVLQEGTRLSILYTLLAVGLLAPVGDLIIPGIYSTDFTAAGLYFVGLLPVLALRALPTVVFPALLALDAQGRYSRLMTVTAIVNLVLNFALIPRFGAWGAIAATGVAMVGLAAGGIGQLRAIGCRGFIRGALSECLPAAAVATVGAIGLVLLRSQQVSWVFLLLAALGYGAVAALLLLRLQPPRLGYSANPDPPQTP